MANIDQLRTGQPIPTTRSNQTKVGSTSSDAPSTAAAASSPRVKNDAVSLSAQGKAVGQIHQQLAAEPSFDSAKVAEIKQAIADGSYKVDADKLASNMTKFEDELRGI
ncbi:flagellar biosynthesis anti-sigma factor FlgM [Photobacterium sanguinicancri]|uniref:Negative regulator of flagellin synthesis n=1 Tax=Photobacterium sanguinicancri TaxID=875932 RepID=A0AAW7Y9I4_9GAMM|nr:flagellar biosynthesis anti-sigma factor FlgM [Photobacterium sanguinicancri]KXI24125.1 flagellar biosynthesis anti-sigma factor FlgM [Photobacterium sanguinicancri]MDO6543543.1 flagellar biosynthesis anti-sigma factor FlgM [Photobacterium sanguinicancri]OZS45637.1 flagellar biosynthesis anti-sigma factor FlgM [Photobacterium sanguinicancri]